MVIVKVSICHKLHLANITLGLFGKVCTSENKLFKLPKCFTKRMTEVKTVFMMLFSDSVEVMSVLPITATSSLLAESAIIIWLLQSAELAPRLTCLRMRPEGRE